MEGVTYQYSAATEPVICDFSVVVQAGSSHALIGPSGSGKTTVLALAGGLLRPQHGKVRVLASVADARAPTARDVGWVLQNARSLSGRSAIDNVAIALLARGWHRDQALKAARASLAEVGLESLAEQRAERLSGGQLQRVCIARAAVARPHLILADEPTGQLDQEMSYSVFQSLKNLTSEHAIALFVATHDPSVSNLCDEVTEL